MTPAGVVREVDKSGVGGASHGLSLAGETSKNTVNTSCRVQIIKGYAGVAKIGDS